MQSHPRSRRVRHNGDNDRFVLCVFVALTILTAFIALIHLGSA